MTTPQPAALPELPDVPPIRFSTGLSVEWAKMYTAEQMRAYALAALQSQPAAAGVSDAELRQAVDALRDPNTVSAFYNGYFTLTPDELRRAILALRPQAVPMAEGWQEVRSCPDGDVWFSLACGHVVQGCKHGFILDWETNVDHDCCGDAEAIKAMPVTPPAHHGIAAPAGGEKRA